MVRRIQEWLNGVISGRKSDAAMGHDDNLSGDHGLRVDFNFVDKSEKRRSSNGRFHFRFQQARSGQARLGTGSRPPSRKGPVRASSDGSFTSIESRESELSRESPDSDSDSESTPTLGFLAYLPPRQIKTRQFWGITALHYYDVTFAEHETALINGLQAISNSNITIDNQTLNKIRERWPLAEDLKSIKVSSSESTHGTIDSLDLLEWIVDLTKDCGANQALKAGLYSTVYGNLLQMAAKWSNHSRIINMHNITSARLKKPMQMSSRGKSFDEAMDFVFSIHREVIHPLYKGKVGTALQTILFPGRSDANAFNFDSTSYEPATIFVKTTNDDIDQGLLQCAVWVDAQIRYLHKIREFAALYSQRQQQVDPIPALPSLPAVGSQWFVQVTKDSEQWAWSDFCGQCGGLKIGDTTSLSGVLKILSAIYISTPRLHNKSVTPLAGEIAR
jgi:hypothetical protein